jgi:hypothetical protein
MFRAILAIIRAEIERNYDAEKANKFYDHHCPMLKEIGVVGHYAHAPRMPLDSELGELEAACAAFGVAYRAAS